ncbi:leukocyte elastase inhibitor A-like isoform X1 [Anguilla rostrata]|uniref:leukocyte elastase inhibitor A-like isoform X1 n=1 Tax=Anguilla rostrata TaxID=7938 RepID=UPI0030CC197E
MDSLGSANTTFALDLFRTLSDVAGESRNVFFSPLSISSALAMVYLGAKGHTADQMAKVLCFNKAQNVHSDFQALSADINKPAASYLLKLANRLYGEKTLNFLPAFLESTQKFYSADLVPLDFIGASEESRKQINQWVEEQTESKIKDLLKPGTVSAVTRLALVNAIYFKGSWMHKFDGKRTKEMPFKISRFNSKPVQMMFQTDQYPYRYIPKYRLQVLEIPYQEDELSMFILLPRSSIFGNALKKLEKELTLENIDSWTDRKNMERGIDICVRLPRFKLEEDYELNTPLGRLGMSDVFDAGRADLTGMNGQGGLYLSAVVHKAFVEVNEEGTEAAVASAEYVTYSLFQQYKKFTADHPFLFFIQHNQSRSILFLGRFCSP